MKLSIIVPVFNGGLHVEEFLREFRQIKDKRIELIFVDGGSTDKTLVVLNRSKDIVNEIITGPDEGIYDAMNKGIEQSRGDFLLFMGVDDRLLIDNLSNLLAELDPEKRSLLVLPVLKENQKIANPVLEGPIPIVHHQGAIFSRTALLSMGGYDLRYSVHSDFDLIQRYVVNNGFRYKNIPVVMFSYGGVSTNGGAVIRSVKELSRIYARYSNKLLTKQLLVLISRPIYYFAFFKLRKLIKP